jgi:hypothetical protein
MKKVLLIIILFMIVKTSIGQQFTDLRGDYLGQAPPGDTPVVFAHGIVSNEYQAHSAPAFSPDGNQVFWQENKRPKSDNEKWQCFFKTMRRVDNIWTAPEVSPFAGSTIFSADGKRVFFNKDSLGPYFAENQGNKWSEPKSTGLLPRFPDLKFAAFLSIASNGTLYFVAHLEGLSANAGIYRSELVNCEYAKPEPLPGNINLPPFRNWTPFIAPDESYLIFCSTRGLPKNDQGDLFISFHKPDGSWTDPVNLGEPVNSKVLERFPSISTDGRYMFFTRDTPEYDEDVYWVSAKIIDKLREKSNAKK